MKSMKAVLVHCRMFRLFYAPAMLVNMLSESFEASSPFRYKTVC